MNDTRLHGTTQKTPLELHAQELPHLLPLPTIRFDTAQVVYRVVDTDGTLPYANNRYSAPWQLIGEQLPVRITENELLIYNRSLSLVAKHVLLQGHTGQTRTDAAHAPPKDVHEQLATMRQRYAELGPIASQFLEGLLAKQRCGKHDALRILGLLQVYSHQDILAAMNRALQYHAYGYQSLERILAHVGTPKSSWQRLSEAEQAAIEARIKRAKFPTSATLESFDWMFNAQTIPRAPFLELATGEFIRRQDNLTFVGRSGLGKTHLIEGIGRSCCAAGYRVRYITSAELIEDLNKAQAIKALSPRVRMYRSHDLLIIDEFGFEKLERKEIPDALSLLYKVIDSRNGRSSTAVVTNVNFSDWTDYLGDPPLVMALLDRVVDSSIIQKFDGKSYRAERAAKKRQAS